MPHNGAFPSTATSSPRARSANSLNMQTPGRCPLSVSQIQFNQKNRTGAFPTIALDKDINSLNMQTPGRCPLSVSQIQFSQKNRTGAFPTIALDKDISPLLTKGNNNSNNYTKSKTRRRNKRGSTAIAVKGLKRQLYCISPIFILKSQQDQENDIDLSLRYDDDTATHFSDASPLLGNVDMDDFYY